MAKFPMLGYPGSSQPRHPVLGTSNDVQWALRSLNRGGGLSWPKQGTIGRAIKRAAGRGLGVCVCGPRCVGSEWAEAHRGVFAIGDGRVACDATVHP